MSRNPFGWNYPPGAEHDPRAPYNQTEGADLDHIRDCLAMVGELEEMIGAEDVLNPCLKTIRRLYDEIESIKLELED